MHILMKFCQICVFIYIGAASGNWAPGKLPHVPELDVFTGEDESTDSSTEAGSCDVCACLILADPLARGGTRELQDGRLCLPRFPMLACSPVRYM